MTAALEARRRDDTWPAVTVVMPIRNESRRIAESLGAVLAQEYPGDRMDIVIADGGSTDDTRALVTRTAAGRSNVTVIHNPAGIVSCGLNAALRCATGDVVVRVDGHTIIAPDYVRACASALARSGADTVGGRMDAVGHTWFGRAVAIATSSPLGVGGARFHYSYREEWVDTVYLGAWRRDVFDRVGLFDEEFVRNQDDEFHYRLRDAGGRILLSPGIRSRYYGRTTVGSLCRQYFQYGYWKVRVVQKHPRRVRPRHVAAPALAAALAGGPLVVAGLSGNPAAALLVPAAYGVAVLLASTAHLRRAGTAWPGVPVALAIMHVAYGSGFLAGLWAFRKRWKRPPDASPQPEPRPES